MSGSLFNPSIEISDVTIDGGVSVPVELNDRFEDILGLAQDEAPVDNQEVVEWMQGAGAHNRILSPWKNDWDAAGGAIEGMSNDGWYPGTITENFQIFRRQQGENIQSAGFVRVDDREGNKVGETPALDRGWYGDRAGFVLNITNFNVQHNTLLAEVKEWPSIPYDGKFRTATIPVENRGLLALPVTFQFTFARPALQGTFTFKLRAESAGTMALELWSPNGAVTDEREVNIQEGGQEVQIVTRGSPVMQSGFINMLFDGFETPPTVTEIDSFPMSMG